MSSLTSIFGMRSTRQYTTDEPRSENHTSQSQSAAFSGANEAEFRRGVLHSKPHRPHETCPSSTSSAVDLTSYASAAAVGPVAAPPAPLDVPAGLRASRRCSPTATSTTSRRCAGLWQVRRGRGGVEGQVVPGRATGSSAGGSPHSAHAVTMTGATLGSDGFVDTRASSRA